MRDSNNWLAAIAGVLTVMASGNAFAEDNTTGKTGLGVGAAAMISGPAGPSLTYDAGSWHIDGILAIADTGPDTELTVGGRFMYVVHRGVKSDFSVGGGAGLFAGMNDVFFLEGGAQIRAFIVPNVALVANLGLAIQLSDNPTTFDTPAQLQGSLGVTYFFF